MKFIKFVFDNSIKHGILTEANQIQEIIGEFNSYQETDNIYKLQVVRLLAPVRPEKIVCVGLNYHDHAKELNMTIPDEPVLFSKPTTSVIGPEDGIIYPSISQQVDYEAELAIVISKQGKDIPEEKAYEYILGYTCANDVTARDLQRKDGQWTRAKSFDTFLPLGPYIETELDPTHVNIKCLLNGEVKQSSNTNEMIFSIPYIVNYVSKVMTLNYGDVIITGTPPGVGSVQIGDVVEVQIEGLGVLKNKLVSANI